MNLTKTLLSTTLFMTVASLSAQTVDKVTVFVEGTTVSATQPDPVALATDGSVWVSFQNGADSTGLSGSSTVVQFDGSGNPVNTYTIAGSVDGLKQDPISKRVWALQNQDGNSTLTTIDLSTGITSESPYTYAAPSATSGYDDVVFEGKNVYMSYTNPPNNSAPIIQQITNLNSPIQVKAILLRGATGTNLATGQTGQALPANDPDSLKQTPDGKGLQLSSGDDGAVIFVHNPGESNQTVSFLNVLDPSGNATSGLDDCFYVTNTAGTFYLSDTNNNRVLKIHVSGITPGQFFASSGSQNALVIVNTKTGISTVLYSQLSGPHGMTFVADPGK